MLNPYVSCIVYAFDLLIIYIFFSRISEKILSTIKCFIIGILLFEAGSFINLLFHNNLFINTVFSITIRALFAIFCFGYRKFQAICYSVVLVVINFALELVSVFSISYIAGTEPIDYNTNMPLLITECSTCKILLFLTCLILSAVVVPSNSWSRHQLSLFLFPITSSFCLAIFWYICLQPNTSTSVMFLLSFSSVIIFTSTILLFIIYQHQVELDNERIHIKRENERLQIEKSYYDILDKQNQQLMLYAHDTKNHLAAIQNLNENPKIDEYITALINQLKSHTSNCHSGNMMLDVIINKYVIECEQAGVSFDYYVRSCNLSGIEDIDLVAIIGNLLDNALAAASASEDRYISLETTTRNNYQIIIITNSCNTAPVFKGDRLITQKADKSFHGYGLRSVKKTLRKYSGDFSWEYDEMTHQFVVTTMIGKRHKA